MEPLRNERKKLVVIESPVAGTSPDKDTRDREVVRNIFYARACLRDSFTRGEYPFASHLLYTQLGVLNDNDEAERRLGMEARLAWVALALTTAVYNDLGISSGMRVGIERAIAHGRTVEHRSLGSDWEEKQRRFLEEHPHHPFANLYIPM